MLDEEISLKYPIFGFRINDFKGSLFSLVRCVNAHEMICWAFLVLQVFVDNVDFLKELEWPWQLQHIFIKFIGRFLTILTASFSHQKPLNLPCTYMIVTVVISAILVALAQYVSTKPEIQFPC